MIDACSHVWIDPSEPPMQRAPYSPVIGLGRRAMQVGVTYHCRNCGSALVVTANRITAMATLPDKAVTENRIAIRVTLAGTPRTDIETSWVEFPRE